MSENMTYVPSRLTSAKTNKVVAGANEILDDDINLKQDVINTLSKKVIDLNSVPTSSTLTYTVNSVTCNFKVGDEVRVADQESETGYTFYKLYALNTEEGVTTATWNKLGGGGAAPILPETVTIVLSSTESDNDQNIIGATITVTNNDTSETILSSSWNGINIVLPIDAGIYYTVTVSSIQGYPFTPSPRAYSSIAGVSRIITMKYMAESIDLGLTSGTLWCSYNVGATNIYDRGLYFAWGRTTGYIYNSGHNFSGESIGPSADLSYSQDAAYVNSNGKFRMPSEAEIQELIDETDIIRDVQNGLSGLKFMKKTDHSIYIFLPGAAWYWYSEYGDDGTLSYWSKTYQRKVLRCDNGSTTPIITNGNDSNGCTVRGVKV